jgi:uncharacterized phage infection (PIP) family protein YhgE
MLRQISQYLFQAWTFVSSNMLVVIGLVISAITAFGVFYGPKMAEDAAEKKEKLKTHFNGISKLIGQISNTIDSVTITGGRLEPINIRGNRTVEDIARMPFPKSFDFEEMEQYQSFKSHYPMMEYQWQDYKRNTSEQNKNAEAFEDMVSQLLKSKLNLPTINHTLPSIMEGIEPYAPSIICRTLYEVAQGQTPAHDLNKAVDIETKNLQIVKVGYENLSTVSPDKVDYCKSVFKDIQQSSELRKEAFKLIENANEIRAQFSNLSHDLKRIASRGFMSKDRRYSFKMKRKCPICRELFW